jgi:hypothetical protein
VLCVGRRMSDTSHDRAGEYQCVATVDAEGYVVAMAATRNNTLDFYKALKSLPRYELPEIVLPDGWVRDARTGRGIRTEEVGKHDGYYVMDLRSAYAPPNEEAA